MKPAASPSRPAWIVDHSPANALPPSPLEVFESGPIWAAFCQHCEEEGTDPRERIIDVVRDYAQHLRDVGETLPPCLRKFIGEE